MKKNPRSRYDEESDILFIDLQGGERIEYSHSKMLGEIWASASPEYANRVLVDIGVNGKPISVEVQAVSKVIGFKMNAATEIDCVPTTLMVEVMTGANFL